MKDSFENYHPLLNFIFFAVVIGVTMFVTHPAILLISLFSAICYICVLKGIKAMLKSFFCFALPVMLLAAIMNPLFNHYGVTILGYMSNGNPITLESIVYGFVMALMLAAVIMWFSCYNAVMTSDKFIYIFGRILPALSLIISMALRFVPRFSEQAKRIDEARRGIGKDARKGNIFKRIKCAVVNCSILITWALENSIDTADSMKARGYGSGRRTAYSIFCFEMKDIILACIMSLLGVCCFAGLFMGAAGAIYNPIIKFSDVKASGWVCYISYALFCMLPVAVHAISVLRYRRMEKNIEKNPVQEWRLWEL